MWQRLAQLRRNEQGATAVEYGLILVVVVLAMIGALTGVAEGTIDMWNNVSDETTSHL